MSAKSINPFYMLGLICLSILLLITAWLWLVNPHQDLPEVEEPTLKVGCYRAQSDWISGWVPYTIRGRFVQCDTVAVFDGGDFVLKEGDTISSSASYTLWVIRFCHSARENIIVGNHESSWKGFSWHATGFDTTLPDGYKYRLGFLYHTRDSELWQLNVVVCQVETGKAAAILKETGEIVMVMSRLPHGQPKQARTFSSDDAEWLIDLAYTFRDSFHGRDKLVHHDLD